jgi:hypothetical protein
MTPFTSCQPPVKRGATLQQGWLPQQSIAVQRRLVAAKKRHVAASVAQPDVAKDERSVFSNGITDSDVLQCPNIRQDLFPQPSPLAHNNNSGGGYATALRAIAPELLNKHQSTCLPYDDRRWVHVAAT